MKKIFRSLFTDTYLHVQKEHAEYIKQQEKFSSKLLIIILTVCISLIIIEYFGKNDGYYSIIKCIKSLGFIKISEEITFFIEQRTNHQLFSLGFWVLIIVVFYLLIPIILVKSVFKERLSDYGISKGNLFKEYKIYLFFFVMMLPLIYFFSTTEGFKERYPFYKLATTESLWPNFFIWQFLYFIQFVSLEFFFRGFMVHGLKKYFGYYAIFVMVIPYCMIHFGKPFPETLGSIIAGIVLGTVSLKSRSIWLGVMIHYVVALSMDLSALWQKGYWVN